MPRLTSITKDFTHIVVGAGSAGCVLANRLSAVKTNHVLLVEAGARDRGRWDSWKIQMPAALTYNLADDRYNWCYWTEPQKHLNNRRLPWPRGKVLGGSSSLNAMVYIRGHAKDYDRWESLGADGWNYANCLPYFQKAQTHELGGDAYRGDQGPLYVSRGKQNNPLFQAYIDAGVAAGYPFTEDMNGYQQEGFGHMDMTIKDGRRWSTANAYLAPAFSRENLTVVTSTLIEKIVFDGKRAIGVEVSSQGEKTIFKCSNDVILSAGAINSPQILMLSGVGDARELKEHGVEVVADIPAVGKNLQDHLDLYIQCPQPITLYNYTWKNPFRMISTGLQWFLLKQGAGVTAHLEAGGFIRSRAGVEHPDLQYHFLPGALTGQLSPGGCHAFQSHLSTLRPLSRGFLKLKNRNPASHVIIQPNYFDHPQDLEDYVTGVKLTFEILEQEPLKPFRGKRLAPDLRVTNDAEIADWIRSTTESAYHPCSTCKMGTQDDSVVDPLTMRVHGLEGIRVVDASVMPDEASGNLNAPTIMIAERSADLILENPMLPPNTADVYTAPNWVTHQR